jgi:uncharacterized iron-regulated protein
VDITAAALPFKILRARGGTEVPTEEFLAELAGAAAVCIGESHKNPHHHWAQLHLFDELSKRNAAAGIETALGMEMFQRPFQGVLDDYAAGRISDKEMLARTGYEQRWGYDWGFYGPIVKLAVDRKHPLLALNTERELTKRISKLGPAKLSADERARLPELQLDDPRHRAWWDKIMGDMGDGHGQAHGEGHGGDGHGGEGGDEGGGHGEADEDEGDENDGQAGPDGEGEGEGKKPADSASERIYAAQVLWDETMAEGAVRWLGEGKRRQVVILAGNGHCHDSAVVGRIKRRGVSGAVSVRPILEAGDGEVAAALAEPETDYLLVMTIPE